MSLNIINRLKRDLQESSSKEKAKILQKFFKTAPGEYGYGDVFIGVTVPKIRAIADKYKEISLTDIYGLLKSAIHEERLLSLIMLVLKFKKGDDNKRKEIYDFYIKNIKYINNWDLVDLTAPSIVGAYLEKRNKNILYDLALSKNLWERRVSVISTLHFIRNNSFSDTLKLAKCFLKDEEDLIHKACGWMLREIAKRDKQAAENFLLKHKNNMPRVMLRYAIERFSERERKNYLKKYA